MFYIFWNSVVIYTAVMFHGVLDDSHSLPQRILCVVFLILLPLSMPSMLLNAYRVHRWAKSAS